MFLLLRYLYAITICKLFATKIDYLVAVLSTPIIFILDLILLPAEIIAAILYRIIEGEDD